MQTLNLFSRPRLTEPKKIFNNLALVGEILAKTSTFTTGDKEPVKWVYEGGAAVNLISLRYLGYFHRPMHDLDIILEKPIILESKNKNDLVRIFLEDIGIKVENLMKNVSEEGKIRYVVRSLKIRDWNNIKVDISFPLHLDGVHGTNFTETLAHRERYVFGKLHAYIPPIDYMISKKLKVTRPEVKKKTDLDLRHLLMIRKNFMIDEMPVKITKLVAKRN